MYSVQQHSSSAIISELDRLSTIAVVKIGAISDCKSLIKTVKLWKLFATSCSCDSSIFILIQCWCIIAMDIERELYRLIDMRGAHSWYHHDAFCGGATQTLAWAIIASSFAQFSPHLHSRTFNSCANNYKCFGHNAIPPVAFITGKDTCTTKLNSGRG